MMLIQLSLEAETRAEYGLFAPKMRHGPPRPDSVPTDSEEEKAAENISAARIVIECDPFDPVV